MILSAGLKIDSLISPTHRPVDLPTELAVKIGQEIEVTGVTATAGVVCLGAILGEACDLGKVGVALGAKDAYGVVNSLFGVVLGLELFFALGGVLGFEGVENFKNLFSLLERLNNVLGVFARAIHICLIAAVKLDAKLLHGTKEFFLKVLCIVFVTAPRVGNINVRGADIFVVVAANNRLYVCGNLAATVVFVPREQELCFFTKLLQGANDHQGRSNVAEVTNVNRARGTDTRGAHVFFFFGVASDNTLGNFF